MAPCTAGSLSKCNTNTAAQHLQSAEAQRDRSGIADEPVGNERRVCRPAEQSCIGVARVEVVCALQRKDASFSYCSALGGGRSQLLMRSLSTDAGSLAGFGDSVEWTETPADARCYKTQTADRRRTV